MLQSAPDNFPSVRSAVNASREKQALAVESSSLWPGPTPCDGKPQTTYAVLAGSVGQDQGPDALRSRRIQSVAARSARRAWLCSRFHLAAEPAEHAVRLHSWFPSIRAASDH